LQAKWSNTDKQPDSGVDILPSHTLKTPESPYVNEEFGPRPEKSPAAPKILVESESIKRFMQVVDDKPGYHALEPHRKILILTNWRVPWNLVENAGAETYSGMRYRTSSRNRLSRVIRGVRKTNNTLGAPCFVNFHNVGAQDIDAWMFLHIAKLALKPLRLRNIIRVHAKEEILILAGGNQIVESTRQSAILLKPKQLVNASSITFDCRVERLRYGPVDAEVNPQFDRGAEFLPEDGRDRPPKKRRIIAFVDRHQYAQLKHRSILLAYGNVVRALARNDLRKVAGQPLCSFIAAGLIRESAQKLKD
jgi:hypothetical protein